MTAIRSTPLGLLRFVRRQINDSVFQLSGPNGNAWRCQWTASLHQHLVNASGRIVVVIRFDRQNKKDELADLWISCRNVYRPTGRAAERNPMIVMTGSHRFNRIAATLRWFTAGGAIRIAIRQLSQTWKLRHYDVITRKL